MSPWRKLLVLRSLDALNADNIVDWAYAELLAGQDTPSLRILAGLRAPFDRWETDHYLEVTLDELGWIWEDGTPFWNESILELAREVLSGARSPLSASRDIYRIYSAMGYPNELESWYHISDRLDPHTHQELKGQELEIVICRECQRMLDSNSKTKNPVM